MRETPLIAAVLAVASAAPALGQDGPPMPPQLPADAAFSVTYVCDGGAVLQAAYVNVPDGPSLAVIAWQGRLVPMQTGPTGSGARYVPFDPARAIVWHTKGDEGSLVRTSLEAVETDEVLLTCVVR